MNKMFFAFSLSCSFSFLFLPHIRYSSLHSELCFRVILCVVFLMIIIMVTCYSGISFSVDITVKAPESAELENLSGNCVVLCVCDSSISSSLLCSIWWRLLLEAFKWIQVIDTHAHMAAAEAPMNVKDSRDTTNADDMPFNLSNEDHIHKR